MPFFMFWSNSSMLSRLVCFTPLLFSTLISNTGHERKLRKREISFGTYRSAFENCLRFRMSKGRPFVQSSSDVSGVFYRVSRCRLITKLRTHVSCDARTLVEIGEFTTEVKKRGPFASLRHVLSDKQELQALTKKLNDGLHLFLVSFCLTFRCQNINFSEWLYFRDRKKET